MTNASRTLTLTADSGILAMIMGEDGNEPVKQMIREMANHGGIIRIIGDNGVAYDHYQRQQLTQQHQQHVQTCKLSTLQVELQHEQRMQHLTRIWNRMHPEAPIQHASELLTRNTPKVKPEPAHSQMVKSEGIHAQTYEMPTSDSPNS